MLPGGSEALKGADMGKQEKESQAHGGDDLCDDVWLLLEPWRCSMRAGAGASRRAAVSRWRS